MSEKQRTRTRKQKQKPPKRTTRIRSKRMSSRKLALLHCTWAYYVKICILRPKPNYEYIIYIMVYVIIICMCEILWRLLDVGCSNLNVSISIPYAECVCWKLKSRPKLLCQMSQISAVTTEINTKTVFSLSLSISHIVIPEFPWTVMWCAAHNHCCFFALSL